MIEQSFTSPRPLARAPTARLSRASTVQLLLLMLGILCGATAVRAATLNVQLTDALAGTPIANQPIGIYEKDAAGALTWKRGGTTDANGRTTLEVNAPAAGSVLVARMRPFAMWIERPVGVGGTVNIAAGPVRVQVRHGVSGAPLVGAPVLVGVTDATNKFIGVVTVTTDPAGQLRLDPDGLGSRPYSLRAASPVDGSFKFSAPITAPGNVEFRVGNAPVTVNLTDWITNAPLAGQLVTVRERMPDGSLVWLTARETDGNGRVKLDLDGLDAGRRYTLRVKPYFQNIDRDVSAAGWISIRAGSLPVTLLNGDMGGVLANTQLTLLTRDSPTSEWRYELHGSTGTDGKLIFDPSQLDTREYVLRAASPVDGSQKFSPIITTAGPTTFAVGNRRLTIKLFNAKDNAPIAAQPVWANELMSDGSIGPTLSRNTDASGLAHFDLDGLGKGKRYRVRTKPFFHVIERIVTTPGWTDLPAGVLRIRVENGATGGALAHTEVRLTRLLPDGSREWVNVVTTDSAGGLVLDPPGLGSSRYQLAATSPVDATWKFSQVLNGPGDAVFSVGSAGVTVRLQDFRSSTPLAGQTVSILERQPGGTLSWVAQRATDASGQVRFDLDGVGTRRYVARVKPYLQTIERDITVNGLLEIRAGNLRVDVRRGDNSEAYREVPVRLLAVRANGEYEAIATLPSSPAGELVLDLPDLGPVRYVLRAASPVDGTLKHSQVFASPGHGTFTVGNPPLRVRLADFQTRRSIPNVMLHVWELQPDGSSTWNTQRATDINGNTEFDLDGLGKGRVYLVKARPFAQWLEHRVDSTLPLVINSGRATVVLVDQDQGRPMPGVRVAARSKAPDGTMTWAGADVTDANGRIRFDPPQLGQGGVAVYTAENPFANGVNYLSAPSVTTGITRFDITRSGPRRLDTRPAEVSLSLPRLNQRVSLGGIVLGGQVKDDTSIRSVVVELLDGSVVVGRHHATVDADNQRWTLQTPAFQSLPNTRLTLRVLATDRDYNVATAETTVMAVADTAPPTLTLHTPAGPSAVHNQGLLVLGNVRDDTQWSNVKVQLERGANVSLPFRNVEVNPATGDWAFAIPAEALLNTSAVTLRVHGLDTQQNVAELVRTLPVDPNGDALRHLLARATFGENAALRDEAQRLGYTTFLEQQLTPALIDDSATEALMSALPVTGAHSLSTQMLVRTVTSRRQLNEVMTFFWENHFNTDVNRHGRIEREQADNYVFRANALGNFRTLLGASARSTAMLVYLDNASNHRFGPNENYARELLELHTMGEGFTQQDIDEVARAFTGWTVVDNAFAFAADRHDGGEKRVLGQVLPAGGGQADGDRVLDLLANRPETARHLCRKLALRFVNDAPPASLIAGCADVFMRNLRSADQLAQVLRYVLNSAEFRLATNRGSKVKDSVRFLAGAARATDALRNGLDLPGIVSALGQPLLTYPAPDGYPLDSDSWTGPFLARTRLEFVGRLMENWPQGTQLTANPRAVLQGLPAVSTTEGVAARVLQNLNGGVFDQSELELALGVLTDNGARRFALDATHADDALRRLVRTVMSLPRHQMH